MTFCHVQIRTRASMTDQEFINAFLAKVHPQEWSALGQFPAAHKPWEMVLAVIALRQTADQIKSGEVPPGHPLAARKSVTV